MNGLLVVDKPAGRSSHGVVAAVRRLTGEQRVGHTGTLDPMATGVLVVLVGQAARIAEYLVEHDKTYQARVRLGIETDTYDATGRTVGTHAVDVAAGQVEQVLQSFVGEILQMPPAHSAIQRDGMRAYQLARRGLAVELEPRRVTIYSIQFSSLQDGEAEFQVRCGKGTYIRSLAHDLGAKLGTGGHLSALRRLVSGPFTIEQSETLVQLERAAADGTLARHLLPMDVGLQQFESLSLDAAATRSVRDGKSLPRPLNLTTGLVRAYDENGTLIALLEPVGDRLKPKKVFNL